MEGWRKVIGVPLTMLVDVHVDAVGNECASQVAPFDFGFISFDHVRSSHGWFVGCFLISTRQVRVSEVHGTQEWVSSLICNSMLNRLGILWPFQGVLARYVHIEIIFVHNIGHKMMTRQHGNEG